MRRAGLDIGSSRVGVAVSDTGGKVASPHDVWDAAELRGDRTRFVRFVEDYEIAEVVVGLPLSMDGTEGPQAAEVRRVAEALTAGVDVTVTYQDERLSSAEAERTMAASGLDARERRGRVDMVAAAIILQAYLDAQRTGIEGDEGEL